MYTDKRWDKAWMILTIIGALAVGACLLLSELVFPTIEELPKTPLWYLAVFCASFLIAGVGMVGGVLTKNKTNTKVGEIVAEAVILGVGILCLSMALSRTEAYWKDVVIGIGGAFFVLGFFCGIPTAAGLLKRTTNRSVPLSSQDLRWNRMMERYADEKLASPLYELIDYQNGIYGEGHHCYFDTHSEELDKISGQLQTILPDDFRENFEKALSSYQTGECTAEVCWDADTFFYQNGKRIDDLLKACADEPDADGKEALFQKGIKSGGYLEFQYCEKDLPMDELLNCKNITNWEDSSLFVNIMQPSYADFVNRWLPYFQKGHFPNGENSFDEYGINYYTKEETAGIYQTIQHVDGLPEKTVFLNWLQYACEKTNGFYILGV